MIFAVASNAVSNCPIFVPTLVVPYNKLPDAVIVGAVILVFVLPVIFPESIVPVIILLVAINVGCFVFKLVSILAIFVATLVVPYNKLPDAVIVGAVILVFVLPTIFPELIVPVVILIFEANIGCLLFTFDSILVIFVAILLLVPYIIVFA